MVCDEPEVTLETNPLLVTLETRSSTEPSNTKLRTRKVGLEMRNAENQQVEHTVEVNMLKIIEDRGVNQVSKSRNPWK